MGTIVTNVTGNTVSYNDKLTDTDIITAPEASEEAGVSDAYIRKECKEGSLKATKHGRDWLIAREDFDLWMKKPRRGSRSSSK